MTRGPRTTPGRGAALPGGALPRTPTAARRAPAMAMATTARDHPAPARGDP